MITSRKQQLYWKIKQIVSQTVWLTNWRSFSSIHQPVFFNFYFPHKCTSFSRKWFQSIEGPLVEKLTGGGWFEPANLRLNYHKIDRLNTSDHETFGFFIRQIVCYQCIEHLDRSPLWFSSFQSFEFRRESRRLGTLCKPSCVLSEEVALVCQTRQL